MAARKNKKELTDSWKDEIRITMLMKRLIDHYLGKLDKPLDATQIKAAEVVLSRLVPTLSAVEQTNINPADQVPENQLVNNMLAMFLANPGLLQTINDAVQQKALEAQPSHTPDVTH